MRNLFLSATSVILVCASISASGQENNDPVKEAMASNKEKSLRGELDNDVAVFLVKSADARMMDSFEGKLAAEKGTTSVIREYGQWMVSEQSKLLAEIKTLSADQKITLPDAISNKKKKMGKKLAAKEGSDFDKKFMKMITIDHKRDVRLFKKATEFDNKEVSSFAATHLPVIQSHLDKILQVKKNYTAP